MASNSGQGRSGHGSHSAHGGHHRNEYHEGYSGGHGHHGSSSDGSLEGIPDYVLRQAEAAAAVHHTNSHERRHVGNDVPVDQRTSLDGTQPEGEVPPPAYGDEYGKISQDQDGFGTNANISEDGRVNIRINQRNRRLSEVLMPALRQQQDVRDHEAAPPPPYIPPSLGGEEGVPPPPPMNVVIHVVGSRGDVQPFVALGKVLKDRYKHRVRLATHATFQKFVTENGLEFFNIGGDPAELMAFMVKNPGLMPGFDTLRTGDVGRRRKEIAEMTTGCWRSCFETGDGMGPGVTEGTTEDWMSSSGTEFDDHDRPFIADAIIANPPSFAHIHCAEKLGIPLHIMFTMPWSPTQAFPHPLANIQSSNADPHLSNYISYALVDTMTWQGLGDVINRFRAKSLGLEPISLVWAPGMLQRLKIPHTYCWSPALIPKPKDWGPQISVSGFYFLNLASNFTPEPDLKDFLDAGPPPVYIGFGSIVLDDPNTMTKLLFDAVRITGQRALVSKGWGGMGADELGKPDNVFMLGNVPHDWLFKRVSCVVHHGGAGTTAAGITAGKPTVVVPFFGDQPFWGAMVARAGAGPQPIHHKSLTAENLAAAIQVCLEPQSQERAGELAAKIAKESGNEVGAQSFHQMLDTDKLRCTLCPSHVAVWRVRRTQVRLSALAATTLANEGMLTFNDLKLFRPREYETEDGPWDPVTGGATSIIGTMSQMMMGVADLPVETLKALRIHPDMQKAKAAKDEQKSQSASQTPVASTDQGAKTPTDLSRVSDERSERSLPSSRAMSGASTPATSGPGSTFNLEESLSKLSGPGSKHDALSPDRAPRGSSMSEALRNSLAQAKTRSRSASRTRGEDDGLKRTETDMGSMYETAMGTGKGVSRIVGAGVKSPMDFTMALAKGFHNAPKLYNDDTVRKSGQVTDLKSGIREATKEFGFGLYDGITGLATQPIRGAQKEGAAGFVKGIGKGIGGIMLKPGAAIFGIPGYTMKGVYKEMQARMGSSVHNYIIAARTAQGYEAWNKSTAHQRQDIVERWKHLQKDLKKKKNPDEIMMEHLKEGTEKKKLWLQERKGEIKEFRSRSRGNTTGQFAIRSDLLPSFKDPKSAELRAESRPTTQHALSYSPEHTRRPDEPLEKAIQTSVTETSQGNPEEDAAIEQAIRASMAELQLDRGRTGHEDDEEALRRAIAASAAEAQQQAGGDDVSQEDLEKALAQSMKEQQRKKGSDSEWDTNPDTEDEEDYKRAIEASRTMAEGTDQKTPSTTEPPPAYDTGHLAGTTREAFEQQQAARPGEKTQEELDEEEIVMRYVKKQSALEEQHRRASFKGKERQVVDDNDNDEEQLQQALKISMQDNDQQGEASGT